jgi:hypothetical protein
LVIIREINESDIDRGFLDALSNLLPTDFNDKEYAKGIVNDNTIRGQKLPC